MSGTSYEKGVEVFKLQRPLFTNDPDGQNAVLFYNESRTHQGIINMRDKDIVKNFGDAPKVFVMAKHGKNGLDIKANAPWQEW